MSEFKYQFDYSTIPHYRTYNVIRTLFAPLLRMLYKIEYKGLENIPKDTRYIIALNHVCYLDPLVVALPKEVPIIHFMAKAEFFEIPIFNTFMKHMYSFPVKRGKGDTSAIDYGKKIIDEGHVMGICPEGTRVKNKGAVPQRAKAGVAFIAKATDANVLPVAINYHGITYFKHGIAKFGSKITVSFGKIITTEEMGFNKEEFSTKDVKDSANLVMDRIRELWEAEND